MITLSISELKEALKEAYEAGWFGCLECKDDVVSQIVNKNFPNNENYSISFDQSQLTLNCMDTIVVNTNFSTYTTST